MAKLNRDDFIASLKEMNLMEIKELVDAMRDELGIDPTAVAVAAPQAGEASEEAGASEVSVNLKDFGAAKIQVIKAVKEITGLGLKEASDIVTKLGTVKKDVPMDEANKIKEALEAAGATVELK